MAILHLHNRAPRSARRPQRVSSPNTVLPLVHNFGSPSRFQTMQFTLSFLTNDGTIGVWPSGRVDGDCTRAQTQGRDQFT